MTRQLALANPAALEKASRSSKCYRGSWLLVLPGLVTQLGVQVAMYTACDV